MARATKYYRDVNCIWADSEEFGCLVGHADEARRDWGQSFGAASDVIEWLTQGSVWPCNAAGKPETRPGFVAKPVGGSPGNVTEGPKPVPTDEVPVEEKVLARCDEARCQLRCAESDRLSDRLAIRHLADAGYLLAHAIEAMAMDWPNKT